MTLAHLHLIFAHLPIVVVPLMLFVLILGLKLNKPDLRNLSLIGLFITALLTIPVYLTGESAEELVEDIKGVAQSQIENHESAATFAFVGVLLTGALSGLALAAKRYRESLARPLLTSVLVAALVTSGMLAWTGNQGGQIRHTEVSAGFGAGTK